MIYKFYNGEIDTDAIKESGLPESYVKDCLLELQARTKIRIYDWKLKNGVWHFVKIETCKRSDIYDI